MFLIRCELFPEEFSRVLKEQHEAKAEKERQRIRMITADPFDPEAQKLIANEIEKENIDANMEAAMEYNPESFGTVQMLYINCSVNGHPVKAFIDSGKLKEMLFLMHCHEATYVSSVLYQAGVQAEMSEVSVICCWCADHHV